MFEGACDMSLFITFEGGEGSGKTTIAKMLHKPVSYTHLTLPTTERV